MTGLIHPPRVVECLITLFAPVQQAEALLGDLHEEYVQHASNPGVAFARSWTGDKVSELSPVWSHPTPALSLFSRASLDNVNMTTGAFRISV